jgi:hypothetical protein
VKKRHGVLFCELLKRPFFYFWVVDWSGAVHKTIHCAFSFFLYQNVGVWVLDGWRKREECNFTKDIRTPLTSFFDFSHRWIKGVDGVIPDIFCKITFFSFSRFINVKKSRFWRVVQLRLPACSGEGFGASVRRLDCAGASGNSSLEFPNWTNELEGIGPLRKLVVALCDYWSCRDTREVMFLTSSKLRTDIGADFIFCQKVKLPRVLIWGVRA